MRRQPQPTPGQRNPASPTEAGQSASSGRRSTSGHGTRRLSHGLVALGTTAVLAVYTAGYLRTDSAATQFDEIPRRRPLSPPGIQDVLPALDVQPPAESVEPVAAASTPPAPGDRSTGSVTPAAPPPAPVEASTSATTSREAGADVPRSAPASAEPASTITSADVSTAPPPGSIPVPALSVPVASAAEASPSGAAGEASGTASGVTAVPTGSPLPAEPTPPPAGIESVPPAPIYRDGTYTGWGTSRHGDIEATIVIEQGRIASAAISKCWTRYPCSWIVKLPPQVVERQSPETDYISGATQSTNAFYYAVVQALGKAKP